MIKDFETYISEGRMGKLIDAAKNKEERKEDEMGFTSVDMGVSVLWASNYYKDVDKNAYFKLYDLEDDDLPNGWRLPTYDEVKELMDNCHLEYNTNRTLVSEKTGCMINLDVPGYRGSIKNDDTVYEDDKNLIMSSTSYCGTFGAWYKGMDCSLKPPQNKTKIMMRTMDVGYRFPALLVMDK